jgi:hypothetical protein
VARGLGPSIIEELHAATNAMVISITAISPVIRIMAVSFRSRHPRAAAQGTVLSR